MSRLRQKIRALIVDDELLARRAIRLLIQNDPEITIIGECANGFEAVQAISNDAPDLIFLDAQMPELSQTFFCASSFRIQSGFHF